MPYHQKMASVQSEQLLKSTKRLSRCRAGRSADTEAVSQLPAKLWTAGSGRRLVAQWHQRVSLLAPYNNASCGWRAATAEPDDVLEWLFVDAP
jgi:hypothetical protein